jgi:hypothetical protein
MFSQPFFDYMLRANLTGTTWLISKMEGENIAPQASFDFLIPKKQIKLTLGPENSSKN